MSKQYVKNRGVFIWLDVLEAGEPKDIMVA